MDTGKGRNGALAIDDNSNGGGGGGGERGGMRCEGAGGRGQRLQGEQGSAGLQGMTRAAIGTGKL
jgi:hypothetical protein